MYDNWAEVRRQLDQELASEREQRRAQRRQQPPLWHSLWQSLRTACFPYFVHRLDKVELAQTCDGFTPGE